MRGLNLVNALFLLVTVGVCGCGGGGGSSVNTTQVTSVATISSMPSSLSTSISSSTLISSSSKSSVISSIISSSSLSSRSASSAVSSSSYGAVHFVPYFEPNSQWTNDTEAQNAMISMLAQFESILRTSGSWNATIEVYFNDNETSAYASAQVGGWSISKFLSRDLIAPTAWVKTVLGIADPNGVIDSNTGIGADITINWNFALSQPLNNQGLLRHELLHGLGMQSFLVNPSWSATAGVTKPNVGAPVSATIFDAGLVDLGNRTLLGDSKGNGQYILNDYSVDSDWQDSNRSGVAFVGVLDSGYVTLMPIMAGNPGDSYDGTIDFSHVLGVSYVGDHPDWGTVTQADRTLLRGLGYKVVF